MIPYRISAIALFPLIKSHTVRHKIRIMTASAATATAFPVMLTVRSSFRLISYCRSLCGVFPARSHCTLSTQLPLNTPQHSEKSGYSSPFLIKKQQLRWKALPRKKRASPAAYIYFSFVFRPLSANRVSHHIFLLYTVCKIQNANAPTIKIVPREKIAKSSVSRNAAQISAAPVSASKMEAVIAPDFRKIS